MRQVAMILDGYTAIEHAPTDWVNMYDDFVHLYARSGTMYVPTLVVASPSTYQGELYWYQTTDVHANEKLNYFLTPAAVSTPVTRPPSSRILRAGVLVKNRAPIFRACATYAMVRSLGCR